MISKKLDIRLIESHSTIVHATKISDASSILESGMLFGTDKGQHGNFSANGNVGVAKNNEVILVFRWDGQHETMSTPGLDFKPLDWDNGPKPNVLYHCDNGEPSHKGGYLQSNLFPGSTGLIFIGAKPSFEVIKKQPIIRRIFSSESRQNHKSYLYQQKIFKYWASFEGKHVGITPWDESMPRKHPYS